MIEESGLGAAVLNHPGNGVVWLANKLADHGEGLAAGEIVLGGSFTRPVPCAAGDVFHADYGPLGSISVRFDMSLATSPAPGNPFKRRIASPGAQIGLWLGLADPYTAELCATAGFDWLLVDGEHGPNDLRSMLGALQAIAPYPSHPVVRIPQGDTALIKQVLEIGATTLLVPMVESADAGATAGARHALPAARRARRGQRSGALVALGRAGAAT